MVISYFYYMKTLREKIKMALSGVLPGKNSHLKMLPPKRVLKAPPEDKSRLKQSSVLLLLFVENDEIYVCLIKRPSHMKHHAGQIALPGGRLEKGETELEAAFRETFEEIGVPADQITLLGSLSEFYVEVSRFQIQPFVGWLNTKPTFILDPNEVEKTILFPLKKFNAPFCEMELQTVSGKLNVPCIRFEGEIIWGATAMILSEFADLLQQINSTGE